MLFKPGALKTEKQKEDVPETNAPKGGLFKKALDAVGGAGGILKLGAKAANMLPIPFAGAVGTALNTVGNMVSNKPGKLKEVKEELMNTVEEKPSSSKGSNNLNSYLSQAYVPVVVPVPYNSFRK